MDSIMLLHALQTVHYHLVLLSVTVLQQL